VPPRSPVRPPRQRRPAAKGAKTARAPRQRLSNEERERQIVDGAIRFFSEHGLTGQTRELAARINVTHPLLYHYFPNKEALIKRVYKEVFLGRWKSDWETWIEDRSVPLQERLNRFYIDYSKAILTKEWVRILIFSAFAGGYISDNYLKLLSERLLPRIVRETRAELGLPTEKPPTEAELELIWGMHGGIFYIGVRRWIYGLKFPKDINRVLTDRVRSYMLAAPEIFTREAATH
jgi:AcrR family transcriptional regulator